MTMKPTKTLRERVYEKVQAAADRLLDPDLAEVLGLAGAVGGGISLPTGLHLAYLHHLAQPYVSAPAAGDEPWRMAAYAVTALLGAGIGAVAGSCLGDKVEGVRDAQ